MWRSGCPDESVAYTQTCWKLFRACSHDVHTFRRLARLAVIGRWPLGFPRATGSRCETPPLNSVVVQPGPLIDKLTRFGLLDYRRIMTAREQIDTERLEQGEELTQPEFHRRYEMLPDLRKAELIDGTVFMESPTRYRAHSRPQADILHWLKTYSLATPGTIALGNVTLILDHRNELEPDGVLLVSPDHGGQCTVDSRDYLHGGPELVVEVSASTVARDYGRKLGVYLRHKVRELLIWRTGEGILDWFVLRGVDYELKQPDPNRTLRSEVFPGLWLDVESVLAGNLTAVLAQLQHGIDSDEHRAFADQLAARRFQ